MKSESKHNHNKVDSLVEKWVQWIIFSDIYITLGAVCFSWANIKLLGIDTTLSLMVLIASSTMLIYQFSRWTFFKNISGELSKDRLYFWMEQHRNVVLIFIALSVVLGSVSVVFVRAEVVLMLLALGLISILYNINIRVGKRLVNIRKLPFVKIFMIALVWASISVIFPWVQNYGWQLNNEVVLLFWIQFLFIFIITLPFDINDMDVDREVGVKTIPIALGVIASKVLLTLLSLFYVFLLYHWVAMYKIDTVGAEVFLFGISVLMISLLYKTLLRSKRAPKWKIMLWYDGSLVLYLIVYYLSILLVG